MPIMCTCMFCALFCALQYFCEGVLVRLCVLCLAHLWERAPRDLILFGFYSSRPIYPKIRTLRKHTPLTLTLTASRSLKRNATDAAIQQLVPQLHNLAQELHIVAEEAAETPTPEPLAGAKPAEHAQK